MVPLPEESQRKGLLELALSVSLVAQQTGARSFSLVCNLSADSRIILLSMSMPFQVALCAV